MQKKEFYTLLQKNGVIGVKKQDGYQIETDGNVIYIYEEYYKRRVYFIDPDTGLAIHIANNYSLNDIERDLDRHVIIYLETLKEAKQVKGYSLRVKAFKKYKEARLFDEKCSSEIRGI